MKEDEFEEEAKSLTAVDSKASDDFMKADEVITRQRVTNVNGGEVLRQISNPFQHSATRISHLFVSGRDKMDDEKASQNTMYQEKELGF